MLPEQAAFLHTLYDANFAWLYDYAVSALKDRAAAEEITQDTFFTAAQKIDELIEHPNPKGFLMEVMKNKIHEYWRQWNRNIKWLVSLEEGLLAKIPGPSGLVSFSGVLEFARETLSEKEWAVFSQFFQGNTHGEIARKLDITPSNRPITTQTARLSTR
jgi:RNA polymerase sigma-70 factor (ECF subfamily)